MDGIQPYVAPTRSPVPVPVGANAVPFAVAAPVPAPAAAFDPTHVKTPADYLRALRRRIWLVLAVGVPLSVLAAGVVMKQKSVYRAMADVTIDVPQFNPMLSTLVAHPLGQHDPDFNTRYIPNKISLLKSRWLIEQALNDPSVAQDSVPGEETVLELLGNLRCVPAFTNSNRILVTLEGTDPARTAKLLYVLLELFRQETRKENELKNEESRVGAQTSLNTLNNELKALDVRIAEILTNSKTIGPGGKSIAEESYLAHTSILMHKKSRLGEVQQQALLAQMFPRDREQGDPRTESKLAELDALREKYHTHLEDLRRKIRPQHFNSDPSAKHGAARLKQVMESIERIRSMPVAARAPAGDPYETLVGQMRAEIRNDEETARTLLKELQESMPEHQRFLNSLEEREQKSAQIRTMQEKLANFDILSRSQKSPVSIPPLVPEPTQPVRPNRMLNVALGVCFSFGLGIALVCLLENLDHSVKVPEHLSLGLTLPLLGVIPRIRRTAQLHRGGHLWTPAAPDSIEADAYRNLRASLIGSMARHGRIVTLLVTSAKAGEGKSTTALNLAATCARAGERTLLMDVDLRRPSLAGVFRDDQDEDEDQDEPQLGLVDVLRGDLPWQRTVRRTDIPNLDFLPTGDTRDIPIEVLGTVEMRQLILAVAEHYDRVVLDGPAVLGLPDCRMLGPFVDAAVLVVRSGSHELRPLKRAKSFLEQSNVVLAGVVFNGLYEDLENWSSYGPNTPYGYGYPEITPGAPRLSGRAGGLEPPGSSTSHPGHAALPVAGTVQA
jgi:capsular exopolysaccharide synthesis family protein